jgi:hypothetical protein
LPIHRLWKDDEIVAALDQWNQGDVFIGQFGFHVLLHRSEFNPEHIDGLDDEFLSQEIAWHGFAIISQGCDIVRSIDQRPYVTVAALVDVAPAEIETIRKCGRPQYAYLTALADKNLVVDLDRVMTLSKLALVQFTDRKERGWKSDDEAIAFAEAISRKWSRYAFPGDFSVGMGPVQDRIKEKHAKGSDEGKALASLREIRVMAEPDWAAPEVSLTFYFVTMDHIADSDWPGLETTFKKVIERHRLPARFGTPEICITRPDKLPTSDYLNSAPLDLDHLSQAKKG